MITNGNKQRGFYEVEFTPNELSHTAEYVLSKSDYRFAKEHLESDEIIIFGGDISKWNEIKRFDSIDEISTFLENEIADLATWKIHQNEYNNSFGTHNTVLTNVDTDKFIGLEHWNGETWRGYDSDNNGVAIADGETYEVTPIITEIDGEYITIDYEVI